MRDRRDQVLRGPLGWTIVTLAAPSALSLLLSVFGSLVSTVWLSRLVGPPGLAVMASIAAVELCVAAIFGAIANGTMSLLARDIGGGSARASQLVLTSLLLTALVGAVLCLIGVVLAHPLATLLTDDAALQPLLRSYAIGFALATPFLGLATVAIAIFAAAGWAQLAFWRGVLELALLLILTPLFVERLGVIGAPFALGVASLVVGAGMAWTLWRNWSDLRLGARPATFLVIDRQVWRSIAAIGLPPQLGRITNFVAFGLIVGLVLRESALHAAAIGVAYRLFSLATTFGYGCSRAQAIVAGQCIGAGDAGRAVRSLWVSLAIGVGIGLAIALAMPFARPIVELFTRDASVVDATLHVIDAWRWWLVIPVTIWYVLVAAYSATGKVVFASALMIISDVVAVAVVLALGAPWTTAALWGVAAQHVGRAILLALLVRPAFLAPAVARAAKTT